MASKNHKEFNENLRFIDNLTDFLGNSEEQTKEEVKVELFEQGIDIDNMILRAKQIIDKTIFEKKRQWIQDALRIREEMRNQIEADNSIIPSDIETIKGKIKEFMGIGQHQQEALAFFRNFETMDDDDLKSLYRDYVHLLNLKDSDTNNE